MLRVAAVLCIRKTSSFFFIIKGKKKGRGTGAETACGKVKRSPLQRIENKKK
jgi:hypothetical protein